MKAIAKDSAQKIMTRNVLELPLRKIGLMSYPSTSSLHEPVKYLELGIPDLDKHNVRLVDQIDILLVHQLHCLTTTTGNAGQWVFSNDYRQTGFSA